MNGRDQRRVRHGRRRDEPPSSASPIACSASPIPTRSVRPPIRSESAPAIGAMNIGIERPRQDPQPGAERRVALHGLEELREQEDRAEHPEEHEQRGDVRERERAACGRSASAASAPASRSSQATNAATSSEADGERADDLGARPALAVAADHEAPDDPEAGRRSRAPRPGRSSLPAGPCVSCRRDSASGIRTSADRHVQPEDPLPREPLRRPRRRRRGPNATARPLIPPQAPSASPRFSVGHRGAEDRQRQRHHDRAADALHGPRRDQRLDDRSERRGERAEREDAEADREHAPAAEAVAERGAGEEQHGERERVGVDRPLEALERRVQVRRG